MAKKKKDSPVRGVSPPRTNYPLPLKKPPLRQPGPSAHVSRASVLPDTAMKRPVAGQARIRPSLIRGTPVKKPEGGPDNG